MADSKWKRPWLWVVVAGVVAAIIVVVVLLAGGDDKTSTVTVYGTDYTTTQNIDGHNGYVYVYIPVNAETSDVIVEVENPGDTAKIREFLDGLDTFTPGEHIVELSDSNLHFIVDGIEEDSN